MSPVGTDLESVLMRAESLGDSSAHYGCPPRPKLNKRPVTYGNVDKDLFRDNLLQYCVPAYDDVDVMAENLSDVLYACATRSEVKACTGDRDEGALSRWERLLQDKDDSRVWKPIDWKGNVDVNSGSDESRPSDTEFKATLSKGIKVR